MSKIIDGIDFNQIAFYSGKNLLLEQLEKLSTPEERKKLCEAVLDSNSTDIAKWYLRNIDSDYCTIDGIDFTEVLKGTGYDGYNCFENLKAFPTSEERIKYCEDEIIYAQCDIDGFMIRLEKEKRNEIEIWIGEREDIIYVAKHYLDNVNKN